MDLARPESENDAMPYFVEVRDRPGCEQIRIDFQEQHLAYLDSNINRLLAAGGLLDDEGAVAQGGLFILDVDNRADAQRFIAEDPFSKAGLFEIVQIRRWRKGYLANQRLI